MVLIIHARYSLEQDIITNMVLPTRFLRNKDLIDQKLLNEITVIGLGGIGSTVVTLLSIMGWDTIIGWDDDTLEEHNLSSTTYPHGFLGAPKVEAAAHEAKHYSGDQTYFECNNERWNSNRGITRKVITCLDNMDTRMEVYETWSEIPNKEFLIDLRMDALSCEIVTVTQRHDNYDKHWVSDSSIEPAPCTMKHTIFSSSIIGGLGVNQTFNCIANKPYYGYIWLGLLPLNLSREDLVKPSI